MSLMGFEPLTSDVGSCYQLSNHHWPTQATLLLENHSTIQKSVATPIQNQPISWPKIDLLLFKLILSVNFRVDLPIDWLHRYLLVLLVALFGHIWIGTESSKIRCRSNDLAAELVTFFPLRRICFGVRREKKSPEPPRNYFRRIEKWNESSEKRIEWKK